LKGDSPSADFCLVTDKIMPDNPYIHPMWTGSYRKTLVFLRALGKRPYRSAF